MWKIINTSYTISKECSGNYFSADEERKIKTALKMVTLNE